MLYFYWLPAKFLFKSICCSFMFQHMPQRCCKKCHRDFISAGPICIYAHISEAAARLMKPCSFPRRQLMPVERRIFALGSALTPRQYSIAGGPAHRRNLHKMSRYNQLHRRYKRLARYALPQYIYRCAMLWKRFYREHFLSRIFDFSVYYAYARTLDSNAKSYRQLMASPNYRQINKGCKSQWDTC